MLLSEARDVPRAVQVGLSLVRPELSQPRRSRDVHRRFRVVRVLPHARGGRGVPGVIVDALRLAARGGGGFPEQPIVRALVIGHERRLAEVSEELGGECLLLALRCASSGRHEAHKRRRRRVNSDDHPRGGGGAFRDRRFFFRDFAISGRRKAPATKKQAAAVDRASRWRGGALALDLRQWRPCPCKRRRGTRSASPRRRTWRATWSSTPSGTIQGWWRNFCCDEGTGPCGSSPGTRYETRSDRASPRAAHHRVPVRSRARAVP